MGLSQYASREISKLEGFSLVHEGVPHFHELAIRCPRPASEINEALLEEGIIGGLELDLWGEDENTMLLGFSDENTTEQIDDLVSALSFV